MSPNEIDAMEAVWARRLDVLLDQIMSDHRRDLVNAGKPRSEVDAEMRSLADWLAQYRADRRRDIRNIIIRGSLGLPMETADA